MKHNGITILLPIEACSTRTGAKQLEFRDDWTDPCRAAMRTSILPSWVVSDSYRVNFYGPQTSSILHQNSTDRLCVVVYGKPSRGSTLERHEFPIGDARSGGERCSIGGVQCQGPARSGQPDEALSRQRVAIEIPSDILAVEQRDAALARMASGYGGCLRNPSEADSLLRSSVGSVRVNKDRASTSSRKADHCTSSRYVAGPTTHQSSASRIPASVIACCNNF